MGTTKRAGVWEASARSGLQRLAAFVLMGVGVISSGCAMSTDQASEEAVDSASDALTAIAGNYWNQLSTHDRWMAPSANMSCFFTDIGGRFEGGAEWVEIYESSGSWFINGHTSQIKSGGVPPLLHSLHAASNCVGRPVTASKSWSKGQAAVKLQQGGACFLTRVAGKFVGGGESVGAWKDSNGTWWLSGSSGTDQTIAATATCVSNTLVRTSTQWRVGTWSYKALHDDPPPTKACYLQGIRGGFRGAGEGVSISYNQNTAGWYLNGKSTAPEANSTIGATIGCIGDGTDF